MSDDLTALQQMLADKETAASLLDDFKGLEDRHHEADSPQPSRWEICFQIGEDDLPKIREELREYAYGNQ